MILLSATQSVRDWFKLNAVATTPVVPTNEWHRFWRADIRRIRPLGQVVLLTNYDTLYTFVADAKAVRSSVGVRVYLLHRLRDVLAGTPLLSASSPEDVIVHRAVDRSVQAVMNSFFLRIEAVVERGDSREWEEFINQAPVISRDFRFPSELLRAHLKKSA